MAGEAIRVTSCDGRSRRPAAAQRRLAIDTEFVSERRYQALLCLAQVAVPDPVAADGVRTEVIDPLEGTSTSGRWRACSPTRRSR